MGKVIAIDGPAGTGKSTVARKVAQHLGYLFLDTGAMYRAVTYQLLAKRIDLLDVEAIKTVLSDFRLEVQEVHGEKRYFLEGEEITETIRSSEVSRNVSAVSALPCVRESLVVIQQRSVQGHNAVCEGRDMGTVVFPRARYKFFLVARSEVRAQRRYQEMLAKDPDLAQTQSQVLLDLMQRDELDSTRQISPLRAAEDAILVDTSDWTIDQVVQHILEKVAAGEKTS